MALRVNGGNQERWLELVQRWQRSKLSVREFCLRHQLREPSFYSWRRVLRERGLLGEATPDAAPEQPAFVELTVDGSAGTAIEVVVGSRVLRVRPGFDADMLLELVRLLEERA